MSSSKIYVPKIRPIRAIQPALTEKDYLRKIEFALRQEGNREPIIEIISLTTGGTFEKFYTSPTEIKYAVIQNISTEDVTITTGPQGTAGQGILLNAASAAGKGGGSIEANDIDLANLFFVRATAGATLSIYYERLSAMPSEG